MDKFYNLLADLLNIEHQFSSLLYVINILESDCVINRKEELLLLVCFFKLYLSTMKNHTTNAIDFLDNALSSKKQPPSP